MTGRPEVSRLLPAWVAVVSLLAGCHLPPVESPPLAVGPIDARSGYAAGTLVPLTPRPGKNTDPVSVYPVPTAPIATAPPIIPQVAGVARAAGPIAAPSITEENPRQKADALLATAPTPSEAVATAMAPGASISSEIANLSRLRAPILIREDGNVALLPPAVRPADLPSIPLPPGNGPVSPVTQEPPIRREPSRALAFPGVPVPAQGNDTLTTTSPAQPTPTPLTQPVTTPPAQLPPLPGLDPLPSPPAGPAGPIFVGGKPLAFDALAKMVDANGGGMGGGVGCSTCGDCGPGRPCAPGGHKCEPFPSENPVTRFVGLIYETVCCPDPCYQPRWEPIADSAFFVDAPRPVSNTRFIWDYANHLSYPDRAEYFFARGDGKGLGPKALDGLKSIPYLNYNQLTQVTEIAAGPASVAIATPYRSWDAEPFAHSAAGFADMNITAKTLLVDSELFLCAMQMRTYVPIGNVTKGLGDGHVSLEPSLIFGLRLSPDTYVQAQVVEWIPMGGDKDYAGAFLRWGVSLNHVWWQPVKDVQLIETLELTGMSFQDGLYTDPVLGPQKLSGQNNVSVGDGFRLFFCNKFDFGVAGNFGITGKYLVRNQLRCDVRFRY